MTGKVHEARLTVAVRALQAGWSWGVDPRRAGARVLCSPRGAVFLLRGRFLVQWKDFRMVEAS